MNTLRCILQVVVAVLATGCATTGGAPAGHGSCPWGYVGKTGPAHWGQICERAYPTCKEGARQSPIDVPSVAMASLPELKLLYRAAPLVVKNNGHTIEVEYGAGSQLVLGEKVYRLRQFHFHTPSEHLLHGVSFPMELHLVHEAAPGDRAVIGVLLSEGTQNPAIQSIWDNAPVAEGTRRVEGVTLDAAALLPASRGYDHYVGSLTTPPCDEGVQWYVLQEPVQESVEQIKTFQTRFFQHNARPVQPLNGREIEASQP